MKRRSENQRLLIQGRFDTVHPSKFALFGAYIDCLSRTHYVLDLHDEIIFVPKVSKEEEPVMELDKIQIDACARAGHEVNRAFSIAQGDLSHAPWESVSPDQRRSIYNGVIGLVHQDHTNEQSHEAWVVEKIVSGWSVGPKKDLEDKTHPCLVKYDKLGFDDRRKNDLFCETVRMMAKAIMSIPRQ